MNDTTREWHAALDTLELRAGEVFLDAQAEADPLLLLAAERVGPRGRTVGCQFGARRLAATQAMVDASGVRVELQPASPLRLPFRDALFHGVVLRSTMGLRNVKAACAELWRVAKPGARVYLRHTDWHIHLPRVTADERAMISALQGAGARDGWFFFEQLQALHSRYSASWQEMRFDVFDATNRDGRTRTRYDYDWRSLLEEDLRRLNRFEEAEITALLDRLSAARGARVIAERFVAVVVKPSYPVQRLREQVQTFPGAEVSAPASVLSPAG